MNKDEFLLLDEILIDTLPEGGVNANYIICCYDELISTLKKLKQEIIDRGVVFSSYEREALDYLCKSLVNSLLGIEALLSSKVNDGLSHSLVLAKGIFTKIEHDKWILSRKQGNTQ